MGKAGGGKRAKRGGGGAAPRASVKVGSKTRLSRFGKISRKGETGINSAFLTRSAILRRLQLTLKDFRRLCILKGIYPRDPPKALSRGKDKVYYAVKDVARVAHEPLLREFRQFKTLMTKVRRSANRAEVGDARRRYETAPRYTLHHLVKERYPKFGDALADLDDALSLCSLLATLPATGRASRDRTETCGALLSAWANYVARERALTAAFVSVRGVYCRAVVQGVDVTWLVPHAFAQQIPRDVDLRVMATFAEFYECLLKFVLFRLYRAADLPWPPPAAETPSKFLALCPRQSDGGAGPLEGRTLWLAREARYPWLDLVATAAGAAVEGDGLAAPSAAATHAVRDRPPAAAAAAAGLDEVQPQWVVDSLNAGAPRPTAAYAPGAVPPPHPSPFVAYDASLPGESVAAARDADRPRDARADADDADRAALATAMMSKKAKRLYDRMQHGIARKAKAVDRLRARRARIAASD